MAIWHVDVKVHIISEVEADTQDDAVNAAMDNCEVQGWTGEVRKIADDDDEDDDEDDDGNDDEDDNDDNED